MILSTPYSVCFRGALLKIHDDTWYSLYTADAIQCNRAERATKKRVLLLLYSKTKCNTPYK